MRIISRQLAYLHNLGYQMNADLMGYAKFQKKVTLKAIGKEKLFGALKHEDYEQVKKVMEEEYKKFTNKQAQEEKSKEDWRKLRKEIIGE